MEECHKALVKGDQQRLPEVCQNLQDGRIGVVWMESGHSW